MFSGFGMGMDVIDVNVMKLTDWGLYRPSPPRGRRYIPKFYTYRHTKVFPLGKSHHPIHRRCVYLHVTIRIQPTLMFRAQPRSTRCGIFCFVLDSNTMRLMRETGCISSRTGISVSVLDFLHSCRQVVDCKLEVGGK